MNTTDPLEKLRAHIEDEWSDSDDRVSVVINQAPQIVQAAPKASLFPGVPQKLRPAVAIAVVVGAALVGAVATAIEWFRP